MWSRGTSTIREWFNDAGSMADPLEGKKPKQQLILYILLKSWRIAFNSPQYSLRNTFPGRDRTRCELAGSVTSERYYMRLTSNEC